ncbi:MAG: type II secretion system minor pseudopilin GspI [Gammaproteobacteria bacterium]|jgi:general secretion pathway protein I
MSRLRSEAAGFTLLEVLIALAVLAIGLLAVLGSAGQTTVVASQSRDRMLAHWVAMNRLADIRLQPGWPDIADSNGNVEMADRRWHWQARVIKTQDDDLRRIEVDVRLADAPDTDILDSVVGFEGKPQPAALTTGGSGGQDTGGNGNRDNGRGDQTPPPSGLPQDDGTPGKGP